MDVLAIGNSFSEDAARYLHRIARADGVELNIANLMIGGCSLERHFRNMLTSRDSYWLQYNGENTYFLVDLKTALLNRAWDVVTLQQASPLSFLENSYEPYLSRLIAFIRECCPKAKIVFHQTWAYEEGCKRILDVTGDPSHKEMLSRIIEASSAACSRVEIDGYIPSGELFGKLSDVSIPLYRDTCHASLGAGRYALGLLWYHVLTGNSVRENTFSDFDVPVDAEHVQRIKQTMDSFDAERTFQARIKIAASQSHQNRLR